MRRVGQFSLYLAASVGIAASALAQDPMMDVAQAGPRFYYAESGNAVPVRLDVKRTPVLSRRITLDMRDVTLEDALEEIRRQAGLKLMYSKRLIPLDKKVSIKAQDITVAGALGEVLFAEDVDVMFSASAQAMLVPRSIVTAAIKTVGAVSGRVIDASTQEGVAGVRVSLEGTRWGTTTGSNGSYRLAGVAAGAYTLVTRRLGYRGSERAVVVEDEREVTLDVALEPVPSALNEVVVTATGEQRRVELGHVVGRINADSVVREAPVSTISELLTARVAGMQVFQTQGTVGGKVNLLLRGPNSFAVSNEPIVVVDGIRYNTEERGPLYCCSGPGSVEATSPLNDLNPNDIESIEVVKGPAAATLYGTDAANGVIVITTKRGRPGPARWSAYTRGSRTEVSTKDLPNVYWGWGTVDGVPNNSTSSCTLERLDSGECTQQDSVTVISNPLRDPQYSILAPKPSWQYGANVSGGAESLRYYFSADFSDATGPLQMPPAYLERLRQSQGLTTVPSEWREPNSVTSVSLRSNVTAVLRQTFDVQINTGYIRSSNNALTVEADLYSLGMQRIRPGDPTNPYPPGSRSPDQALARRSTDNVDRLVGSVRGAWRPASWVTGHATIGLDFLTSRKNALARAGDQPGNGGFGAAEDSRTHQLATSSEVGASATVSRGNLRARTAAGARYTRTIFDASGSIGEGLAPGQSVVQGAQFVFNVASYRETAVLGGYMEQMLGWNERLFITGAFQMDGAAAFGREFNAVTYPKLGASWLVTEEPFMPRLPWLDQLRLRFALGASGRQPDPVWSRPLFMLRTMQLNGETVQTYLNEGLGNPGLRPERTREHEMGFDIDALGSRVNVDATWYGRRTTDQIARVTLPSGFGSLYQNLGLTTQRGFEARINASVVETPNVSLDVGLQHSRYRTLLVDAGDVASLEIPWGGYKVGYPLGARFAQQVVGFEDRNSDGVIGFSELVLSDTAMYLGESFPPRSYTLSTVVGLMDRRMRVSMLLERKLGFTVLDPFHCVVSAPGGSTCRERVDRNTPVEEQARVSWPVPQSGGFTRLREVTVAIDIPTHLTRIARVSGSTLAITGRNLGLWTKVPVADPEVSGAGLGEGYGIVGGGQAGGIPLGRTLSFRLDVQF